MNYFRLLIVLGLFLLALLTWKGYNTFVTAQEQSYTVSQKNEHFEVRQYQHTTFAQTTQKGGYADAMSAGFKELANYIFAKNRDGEKIAMTAPVLFAPKGTDCWHIRFVLPSPYTKKTAPKPANKEVRLYDAGQRTIAVRRVSGAPTWKEWQKEEKTLREQLAKNGLRARGRSWYARYNPPWIPSFMRRNEIMIEIAS